MSSDEVELKAIRYKKRKMGVSSGRINDSYEREPFKFLWTYSGEKAEDKNAIVVNSSRMDMMHEQAQGQKVLGKVLVMRESGLPGFGSIYQQSGSNFILHSDNITRVLKIPYFPKSTQTKIVSPNSWYIDSIYWTFYIFNMMNLIFSCVALIYFVKDSYYSFAYFNSELNPLKAYQALFLFMIIAVAFIFSIGHSMSGTHSLALIYLYIFLGMVGNYILVFFQYYHEFKENMHEDFRRHLKNIFVRRENPEDINRMQSEIIFTLKIMGYQSIGFELNRQNNDEGRQVKLSCCGVDNPCDWEILGYDLLPRSCCRNKFSLSDVDIFDCPYLFAHHRSCANASLAVYDEVLERHSFMLWGKIFFQWLAILMAMIYAIAVYNGGMEQKNNINYNSAVPVEYFNIVTKGDVEFCLPMNYYNEKETEDYKYMILMNDIRKAVNEREMKYFNERRYMMFDVV